MTILSISWQILAWIWKKSLRNSLILRSDHWELRWICVLEWFLSWGAKVCKFLRIFCDSVRVFSVDKIMMFYPKVFDVLFHGVCIFLLIFHRSLTHIKRNFSVITFHILWYWIADLCIQGSKNILNQLILVATTQCILKIFSESLYEFFIIVYR